MTQWGAATDVPVPGDYDGDKKTDVSVWRPSEGNWYIFRSSDNGVTVTQTGASTDIPVPGDHDGDGKTDLTVYRPGTGEWFINSSRIRVSYVIQWGGDPTDVPLGSAIK